MKSIRDHALKVQVENDVNALADLIQKKGLLQKFDPVYPSYNDAYDQWFLFYMFGQPIVLNEYVDPYTTERTFYLFNSLRNELKEIPIDAPEEHILRTVDDNDPLRDTSEVDIYFIVQRDGENIIWRGD